MGMWVVAALLSCGDVSVPQPPLVDPVEEEAGWVHVREAVSRPRSCYRGWSEYCPSEPALVDDLIQHQLDRHFDGRMPERRRDLEELTRDAVQGWQRFQRSPEGRRLVEARIRELYEDPPAELVAGHGVSLRVGVPPGRLVVLGEAQRPDAPMTVRSPLVEDGEWATGEIARFLERALEAWPDQPAIRLLVLVPREGAGVRRMDVRYYRDLDRIVIQDVDGDRAWVTPPVAGDLTRYLEGRASLHTSGLQRCAVERGSGRPICDGSRPP